MKGVPGLCSIMCEDADAVLQIIQIPQLTLHAFRIAADEIRACSTQPAANRCRRACRSGVVSDSLQRTAQDC